MADRHAESTTTRPGNDAGLQDTSTRQEPVRAEQDKTKPGPASATQRAVAAAQSTAAKMAPKQPPRPTRRARLRLTRIDPWSVMKTSFLLSIAFAVVAVVAVLMVWSVLTAAGVWDSINTAVRDVVGGEEANQFNIEDYVGTSRVLGFTMIVAAVDVVLITAIATLTAFLYNMAATLLGGIEVTLAEDN